MHDPPASKFCMGSPKVASRRFPARWRVRSAFCPRNGQFPGEDVPGVHRSSQCLASPHSPHSSVRPRGKNDSTTSIEAPLVIPRSSHKTSQCIGSLGSASPCAYHLSDSQPGIQGGHRVGRCYLSLHPTRTSPVGHQCGGKPPVNRINSQKSKCEKTRGKGHEKICQLYRALRHVRTCWEIVPKGTS